MTDLSLLKDFIIEAGEHLDELESNLLQLEANPEKKELLNDIFRSVHSIKGAAQFVGLERMSDLSHRLETLLEQIRSDDNVQESNVINILIAAKDRLADLTGDLETTQTEQANIDDLCSAIDKAIIDPAARDPRYESTSETPPTPEEPVAPKEPVTMEEPVAKEVPRTAPAAELSPAPSESRELEKLLAQEIFEEEEGDSELLSIFTEQLNDKMAAFENLPAETEPREDIVGFLKSAADHLGALRSAANYMGYDKLIDFYDQWQAAIDTALDSAETGGTPAIGFFAQFLTALQGRLLAIHKAPPAESAAEETTGDLEETLDELLEDEPLAASEEIIDTLLDEEPAAMGQETIDSPIDDGPMSTTEETIDNLRKDEPAVVSAETGEPQAAAETADSSEPAASGDLEVGDDFSHEDSDEELFEIFLNHATDSLTALSREMEMPDAGEPAVESLERSIRILDSLQSSANYMGYDKLRELYAELQAQTIATREQLTAGKFASLEFWDGSLDRICNHLPQLAESLENLPAPNTDITADVSDDVLEDAIEDTAPDAEAPAAAVETEAAAEEDDAPMQTARDLALFDKLNFAFNASLPADGEDSDDDIPLLEVIEEMIQGEGIITVPHFVAPESAAEAMPDADPAQNTGESERTPASKASTGAQGAGQSPDKSGAASKDAAAGGDGAAQQKSEKATTRPFKPAEGQVGPAMAKKFKQSLRVDADKIDYLMNQVGELVVSRAFFAQLYSDLRGLHQELKEDLGLTQKELKPVREFSFRLGEATVALGRVSNELQEGVMKARMLPISQLFSRYPRLVRDLVHNTTKQVKIETRGEDTELDKMIIEAISDPLIHIIRNTVDHGIEPADVRRAMGKPEIGTLTLEAYHESNHIVIEVADDGRGIDLNRIRAKAIEGGLATEADFKRFSNRELMRLIMTPGFSTAERTTRTSGRGVGMDVVRKNIERLNGSIEIESEAGQYTRIRIKIPLTLAIIAALLVKVGEDIFTIPLSSVEETIRMFESDITTIEGVEVIHLRDKTTPILRLADLFGMQSSRREDGKNFIVIVNAGSQHVGLVVDTLIGQEEVVIKPLPDYLREKNGFSGATIIGDGGISLILDVYELVNMTIRSKNRRRAQMVHRVDTMRPERPALAAPTVH